MFSTGFSSEQLGIGEKESLDEMRRECAGDVLKAVSLAGSGHPGGSLSSLDMLLLVYSNFRHDPQKPLWPDRDRVIISHGHIAAGTYSVLARFGYFPKESFFMGFRRAGTPFSGHVESCVPGIYWNTGNLGQGLSAGAGAALAGKIKGRDYRTMVLMGDGEQQKGQIAEARRFAVKFGLNRLVAFVDYNMLQIGGSITSVMPQNIAEGWRSDGWNVLEVADGHDWHQLYGALRSAYMGIVENPAMPTVIIGRTLMGKGVSFMEDLSKFHGVALNHAQVRDAISELNLEDDFELLVQKRREHDPSIGCNRKAPAINWPVIDQGTPRTYGVDVDTDNRSAYGNALADVALANHGADGPRVVGLTCDLEGSVKMDILHKALPEAFFESGIMEHNTAAVAGALSREGIVPFFSTFGVFGIDETYNQHRLSDINEAAPKVVLTHCGMDVGEDGPTHHCIDYLGVASNLFDFEVFHPADPNQTDRMIRVLAARPRPSLVCMGRSKTRVVESADRQPLFAGDYQFQVGKADLVRAGSDLSVLTYGPTLVPAVNAARRAEEAYGLKVRVLNFATLKPIDRDAVLAAARETKGLITVEDHNVNTGLGLQVAGVMVDGCVLAPLRKLGVGHYASSGSPAALYREHGIDEDGIYEAIRSMALGQGLIKGTGHPAGSK